MRTKGEGPNVISTSLLVKYSFIAVPVAFAGFPLYVLAPDYYVTHHGVSLTLLGALLLVIRLMDAVIDPLIGFLIDTFQKHLKLFAITAACPLCFAIFGLFNFTFFDPIRWFSLCMIFAVTAYSVLTITLGAYATMWTTNVHDQTRIAGAREAFGLMGLIIAVSTPKTISSLTQASTVYLWYGFLLALLMVIGVTCFLSLPQIFETQKKQRPSLLKGVRTLDQKTKRLFAIYGLNMLASSIPSILVIFYVRDLLGAEKFIGLFLILYFLSGVLFIPFWNKISVSHGKYKTWFISNIVAVSGFIGAFFLGHGDIAPYALVCSLSGLALGADLTLPPSLLSDHIHGQKKTEYSGTYYALMTFIAKMSLAFASAIVLPTLDYAGFKPNEANADHALLTLSLAYSLIPCVLKGLSMGLIYFYFIKLKTGGKNELVENHVNPGSTDDAKWL
ncbi:MAG: MFS transporter [Alphaproteobacteria bacterium]|jgi:GPH family glycoside/pentoside/hexuronide:cation symporter